MLRKDFTVSEYQIYEAKCMGADAILLICALLDSAALERFLSLAHQLGLTALVETHTAEEIKQAVSSGANLIGINNRNLKNFSVNLETTASLRTLIPKNVLFVAESGIRTPEDAVYMKKMGAYALLIGEALMKSADPAARLAEFKKATL